MKQTVLVFCLLMPATAYAQTPACPHGPGSYDCRDLGGYFETQRGDAPVAPAGQSVNDILNQTYQQPTYDHTRQPPY